ncbi:MAG TPA: TonB-dependent receptor, partial [Candidatus Aquabacterium excrementipullorum]|nr:TonB-dependent receptor [Candidatus Aquabacterium excrementipullorum]
QHQIVAGVSWQKQKSDGSDYIAVDAGTGNLYVPNTNSYYSVGSFDSLNLTRSTEVEQKALYVSDTVAFNEQWSVLAGLRTTRYDQQGATTDSHYEKSGVLTPSLAVMYRFVPGAMAYASYVESLEAGSIVASTYDNRGELLDPLKSRQIELGLKTERQDWSATAALFRIEKKAEYARDNVLVQDGQSNYQGLELGAAARLGAGWSLGGNLMLLDTEYSKGSDNIGNRVSGAPRFVATAQLGYKVPSVTGLQLNAGAKYTGNTMLRPDNSIDLGGYTLLGVGATYDTTLAGYDTTWRLNVQNLTNKTYWMYQYDDYIKAGDPRTFNLSATLRF